LNELLKNESRALFSSGGKRYNKSKKEEKWNKK
jgi:hypothetical protein